MKTEKILLRKKPDEFPGVEEYFQRLSGIDAANVPEKYGDSVQKAREMIQEKLEIGVIYGCDNIKQVNGNKVILECGEHYEGEMAVRILKDSTQVISFVASLCGYDEIKEKTGDVMADYFLDTWGSAYVECAQGWLGKQILEELKQEGMIRTHLWSPGQHQFALNNQKALFRILKPEKIGCHLTDNFMMIPLKSVSGIMGIVPPDVEELLLPCDFCQYGATCPASKRGCAEL